MLIVTILSVSTSHGGVRMGITNKVHNAIGVLPYGFGSL